MTSAISERKPSRSAAISLCFRPNKMPDDNNKRWNRKWYTFLPATTVIKYGYAHLTILAKKGQLLSCWQNPIAVFWGALSAIAVFRDKILPKKNTNWKRTTSENDLSAAFESAPNRSVAAPTLDIPSWSAVSVQIQISSVQIQIPSHWKWIQNKNTGTDRM